MARTLSVKHPRHNYIGERDETWEHMEIKDLLGDMHARNIYTINLYHYTLITQKHRFCKLNESKNSGTSYLALATDFKIGNLKTIESRKYYLHKEFL